MSAIDTHYKNGTIYLMDKESALILRSLVISINREAMNELIEQEMNPLASEITATESLKKIYYTSIEARECLDNFLLNETA